MPRSFDLRAYLRDRRVMVRGALGALLGANLVAALFAFHLLGGSPDDLAREMHAKQQDLALRLQQLRRTRNLVEKVQQAKLEGDKFLDECTMNRRSAFSTLIGEVDKMAVESGMKPKDTSFTKDPVEGSDTIEQLTVTANYEGVYTSLTKFVNLLDKSPRFLIIESMQAAPLSTGALSVTLKVGAFIRDAAGGKS
jgi:type IV pilus assembly protein PilO